jgi:hypothetical protein
MKDKAGKDCAFFKTIEKDQKYVDLFEKLWQMTKHERIDPSKPLIQVSVPFIQGICVNTNL